MLIVRHELNQTPGARLQRLACGLHDLEIQQQCVEIWPIPVSVSLTQADFFPAEIACPMGPETIGSELLNKKCNSWKPFNGPGYECCIASHFKMALIALVEYSQEALLEDRNGKRIRQNGYSVRRVGKRLQA